MPRTITRHTNRKLYDAQARRYVSLGDIADLVIGGDSVRVVEHPSGLDATPRVLAQTMVDLIKRRAQSLPVGLMETLVRLAGGSRAFTGGGPGDAPAPVKDFTDRARKEAEAIATRLVRRGRLGIEEALHLRNEVEGAIHRGFRAAETATRKPAEALRPGRAVRTIAGLAEELKALETLVAKPSRRTAQPSSLPAPRKAQAPRKKSSNKSKESEHHAKQSQPFHPKNRKKGGPQRKAAQGRGVGQDQPEDRRRPGEGIHQQR